jgi:hypothetical protein
MSLKDFFQYTPWYTWPVVLLFVVSFVATVLFAYPIGLMLWITRLAFVLLIVISVLFIPLYILYKCHLILLRQKRVYSLAPALLALQTVLLVFLAYLALVFLQRFHSIV